MMRQIAHISIVFSLLTVGLFGLASPAQAQGLNSVSRLTTIQCPEAQETSSEARAEAASGNSQSTILAALSGKTLSYRLRCDPIIIGKTAQGKDGIGIYQLSLNLVNFGVLIILLIIAFSNILRIKLDTYAVKKTIPLLVFGVIMANVGLPIIRTLVDMSGALTAGLIEQTTSAGTKEAFIQKLVSSVYDGGASTIANLFNGLNSGGAANFTDIIATVGFFGLAAVASGPVFAGIFMGALFLIVAPAIVFLLLGLLFVARIYVLVLLAAISPLAFASLGFEPLKGRIWNRWWTETFRWTFMVPVTFFIFWLATRFYDATNGQPDIGTYTVTMLLLMYAIQVPLKMGGNVMARWNDIVVKPLGKALYSPFTGTRDFVAKAIPRDVTRWANRTQVFGIPVNQGRYWRELVGQIEAKNEERDKDSLAITRGRAAGQLYSSLELDKAIRNPAQFMRDRRNLLENQLQTLQGRENITNKAQSLIARAQIGPDEKWSDLDDDRKDLFHQEAKKMVATGDPEAIAAVIAAHGVLGNHQGINGEYVDAINDLTNKRNIKTDRVWSLTNRLGQAATGTAYSYGPGDQFADTMKQIQRQMVSASDAKEQSKILRDMLGELKSTTKNFSNLIEIEKNPNYKAWATTLLRYAAKPEFADLRTELGPLNKMRDALGIATPQSVFGRSLAGTTQLSRALQQSAGKPVDLVHLAPLVEKDGAQPANFAYLPPEEKVALMAAHANIDILKNNLSHYLDSQFEQLKNENKITATELSALRQQIPKIVQTNVKGAMPSNFSDSHLPAGVSPDKAALIKGRLATYQNVVENLKTIHDDAGRQFAEKQVAAAVKPPTPPKVAGQPNPTPGVAGAAPAAPAPGQPPAPPTAPPGTSVAQAPAPPGVTPTPPTTAPAGIPATPPFGFPVDSAAPVNPITPTPADSPFAVPPAPPPSNPLTPAIDPGPPGGPDSPISP